MGERLQQQRYVMFETVNHSRSIISSLSEMQKVNQLCDVTLETEDGEQIRAHRVVLAACSPFFHAMFTSNLSESRNDLIKIWEIETEVLQAIVHYCYASPFEFPSDKILALLCASDRLAMDALFDECSFHLEGQLSTSNCLSLRAYAELHNCHRLHKLCTEFVCEHFIDVSVSEEFLSLPCEQLKSLLSMDGLLVSKEEEIYEAVMMWVKHDLRQRQKHFSDIMMHVRLPFVSTTYLKQNIETEELIQSEARCHELLQEAYLYKSYPEKRAALKISPRLQPRKPSGLQSVMLCTGGLNENSGLASLEQYDFRIDAWSELTNLQQSRYAVATCILQETLYVVGGYNEADGFLSSVVSYNMKEAKWRNLSPMNSARRYHDVAVLYGLIYAVGGNDGSSILNSVERYNPVDDVWTFVEPMGSARIYHRVTELEQLLFAIGGHNGHARLATVECYNPGMDQWYPVTPMAIKRSVCGAASLNGSIYVVGGFDGKTYLKDVEVYDIELNKWSAGTPLSCPRSAVGVVTYEGCIYCCGGFNGQFLNSVERYSPGELWWEEVVPMLSKRVHFGISSTL